MKTLLTYGTSYGDGAQIGGVSGRPNDTGDGDQARALSMCRDGESHWPMVLGAQVKGSGVNPNIYDAPVCIGIIVEDHSSLQASIMTVTFNIRTYRR